MPKFCSAFGCSDRQEKDTRRHFRIPAVRHIARAELVELSRKRRALWIKALSRKDLDFEDPVKLRNVRVCSNHFISGAPADIYDVDHPDWLPTVNLSVVITDKEKKRELKLQSEEVTTKRIDARNELVGNFRYNTNSPRDSIVSPEGSTITLKDNPKIPRNSIISPKDSTMCPEDSTISLIDSPKSPKDSSKSLGLLTLADLLSNTNTKCSDKCVQTDATYFNRHNNEKIIKLPLHSSRNNVSNLILSIDSFKFNNDMTIFYTGLPNFDVLNKLFEHVAPYVPESATKDIPKFQQMILTLMKLRLNLDFQDLAYRFNIAQQRSFQIFQLMMGILYYKLESLIVWPSRNVSQDVSGEVYQNQGPNKVVVITDCIEKCIEKSCNETVSGSCKDHNAEKVLIALSPQGIVTFISEIWKGKMKDQLSVENSSFLQQLLPGDLVLAGKGCQIYNVTNSTQETLVLIKRKTLPDFVDVQYKKDITEVCGFVEQVIIDLREKYEVLNNSVLTEKDIIDINLNKIVTVCCCLSNLCRSSSESLCKFFNA